MTEITLRRGTFAEWIAANPILAEGEAGLEMDTGNLKFGDGVTAWSSLLYFLPPHVHDASAITTGFLDPSVMPFQIATPLPTALPNSYQSGISIFSINGETGWPNAYGTVFTLRSIGVNPRGYQILTRKEAGGLAGEQWIRVEYDGNTWSAWNQTYADNVPKNMSYVNGWTDFNAATYAKLKATQVSPGVISIAGMPKGGTLQDGIGIANVPTAFRPTRDVYASCTIRNSTGTINAAGMAVVRRATDVNPGQLQIFGITSTTNYLCLGFTYNIDGD